ncbi:MAG TPA: ABC transporter substrate-binding protein [Myxococcales bacterium]
MIALAFILAVIQPGSASATVQKTTEQVRTAMDRYVKARGPSKTKAREEARAAVGKLIDFDALARSTLGKKWDDLKPAEQKRYVAALRGAMEANYLVKMGNAKAEEVARVKTDVGAEEKQGDRTLVKTTVKSGQETAAIDYVMEKAPKGWRAVDVITEGVSLAETYREQVGKLLPKKGIEGVISALEKKRKALESEMDAPPK